MFICKNPTPCISCILFVFVFVYIIVISPVVIFWNVGFLVIRAYDSACVFAKQYFEFSEKQFPEVRGLRKPVIFYKKANSDVRRHSPWTCVCVVSSCRYIVNQIQLKIQSTYHCSIVSILTLSLSEKWKQLSCWFSSYSRSSVKINIGSKTVPIKFNNLRFFFDFKKKQTPKIQFKLC